MTIKEWGKGLIHSRRIDKVLILVLSPKGGLDKFPIL